MVLHVAARSTLGAAPGFDYVPDTRLCTDRMREDRMELRLGGRVFVGELGNGGASRAGLVFGNTKI